MSLFSLSFQTAEPPMAALDISAHAVTAARVDTRGGDLVVVAQASEPLPAGALTPSLSAGNVTHRAAVRTAVARALEQIGRPRRVALVVPDPVAKVSVVRFEQVPDRARDLEQVIGWQAQKGSPFPLEEGQLSFVTAAAVSGGQEFLVTFARRDVIQEYESLVTDAGAEPGLVDLSTFNVVNAVLAERRDLATADWLLVNVAPGWMSVAILRGPHITLFRSRSAVDEGEGTLIDLVHQTTMYYEDRLGGAGFAAIVVNGAPQTTNERHQVTTRTLEARLDATVTIV
ncbi:MAG: pilus assembly protein PilM, partial [Acidobacteriaceae bacterium]|nr:pilus assembly protein PilM [Acidobacteriaceae bacterium]